MVPPTPISLLEKCNSIAERRARRRLKKRTTETVEIDATILSCPSKEMTEKFAHFLITLIDSKSSSECFHIVLNSLVAVHAKEYPCHSPSDHRVSVNNFLKKVLKCFTETSAINSEQLTLSELFVLLEVHLLRSFPVHLSQTQIVERLRTIYFASEPVKFRHFLDDILCDEFLDDLPFYLAGIYEQLLLEMPLDLQRFQSQEYRQDISIGQMEFKNKLAEQLENFLRELDEENKEETSDQLVEEKNENANEKEGEEDETRTRAPKKNRKVIRPSLKDKHSLARRRIQVIPETPEKDPKGETSMGKHFDENEVIKQTPIGKINGSGPKASHFANLLRDEEEKFSRLHLNPSGMGKAKRVLNVSHQNIENNKNSILTRDDKDETTNSVPKRGKRPATPSNSSSTIAMLNKRPKRRMTYSTKSSTSSVLSFPFPRKS
ncbi:hypothetical protein niasHS_004828 [Heterodera schachtii]|uniref:Uncharacterized protein n=1 Tax=Heterodera schachtii TaxID=97005 RepID=A0ABD2JU74_HETSC